MEGEDQVGVQVREGQAIKAGPAAGPLIARANRIEAGAGKPPAGTDLSTKSDQEIAAAAAQLGSMGDKANPAHKKLIVDEMARRAKRGASK